MEDIAARLTAWHRTGRPFALATVVSVTGSAPREPGAALAVDVDGEAVGSVSGGCVEGAVYDLCRQALVDGTPVLERFGYSDEDAFAVGLTCGGALEVFVHPVHPGRPGRSPGMDAVLVALEAAVPAALLRCIAGPATGAALAVTAERAVGGLELPPGIRQSAVLRARAMLDAGATGCFALALDGRPCDPGEERAARFFVESFAPAPRLLVFGAIDFAGAMVRIGRFLGYDVTVCDARPVFATAARFPEAHRVVVDWPHRYLEAEAAAGRLDSRAVLCVLTHDAKFDVPLLERALRMDVAYVGAMGSRRTHRDRLARLRDVGLGEGELSRLRSPIGLDLGARTPEETAVAVAAEIVAVRRGGGGLSLSTHDGPIHHEQRETVLT